MNRAPASCTKKTGPKVLRVEWERDFRFDLVPYSIVASDSGFVVYWKPYGKKLGSFEAVSVTEAQSTLKAFAERHGRQLVEL